MATRPTSADPGSDAGTMRAVVQDRYGGPEVLRVTPVPRPVAADGQVLVRIRATSVNASDYRLMRADPFVARFASGLRRPTKIPTPGSDLAGDVVAVGPGVTAMEVGDRVFGSRIQGGHGTFAELAAVDADAVVPIPPGWSYADAASVPLAGITALQGIRDRAQVSPGQRVLIHGAGGGVGTMAVQVAVARGAHVTAVCGSGSAALVASLGADEVIDYAAEDWLTRVEAGGERYDVILGVNGHRPLGHYRRGLVEGGRYVMIGGTNRQIFAALFLGAVRFAFSGRSATVLTVDDDRRPADLVELRELMVAGRIRPVIEATYELADAAEAIAHVERGHVAGKVVITVGAQNSASSSSM